MTKIKLGVSACLLGQKVRYDGKDKFIRLTDFFDSDTYALFPICPEVEMGLSIPRPPIQMRLINKEPQLVNVNDVNIKHTEDLKQWFNDNLAILQKFDGFILKSKSPSCGNGTTPLFYKDQISSFDDGFFVKLLKQENSQIAIIDESSMQDPYKLKRFVLKLKTTRSTL